MVEMRRSLEQNPVHVGYMGPLGKSVVLFRTTNSQRTLNGLNGTLHMELVENVLYMTLLENGSR